MSDAENNVQSASEAPTTQQAADSSAAQKTAPTGAPAGSSKESFSTLAELREQNPEVYNKMMEGIAQNICIKIKRQADHLKELQRQYREGS